MLLELPSLLSRDEAAGITRALADAPFTDGKATARGKARDVKDNLQLDPGHPVAKRCGAQVVAALSRSEPFRAVTLPHTILPVRFCRYDEGMSYGEHLDVPVMPTASGPLRTDLSLTVWLNERDSFDGGELVFHAESGERRVKGDIGDAVVYPSTTVHRVAPVTRGHRLVAISWIQSLVRNEEQRAILYRLVETLSALSGRDDLSQEVEGLRRVHYQLLRMWADC